MSEPYWTPLYSQPVDYEGTWAAGTTYAPGDVVVYNGVYYLAVNPSLGTPPPSAVSVPTIGTSLPGSPVDGQVFTLVDSLSAPTYWWRMQYIASVGKWLYIGGIPKEVIVAAAESSNVVAYSALTTPGPSFALPYAGDWSVEVCFAFTTSAGAARAFMSFDIGATAAVDANASRHATSMTNKDEDSPPRRTVITVATPVTLTAKYSMKDGTGVTATWKDRTMRVYPVKL